MGKRNLIIVSVIILLLITAGFLYTGNYLGKRPFRNLVANSIEKATVFIIPPGETAVISDQETLTELTKILNQITIYQQDDSGREYYGQMVKFTLTMKDGTTLEIGAYNPFLIINSVWYKTKYEPCEELNALGNRMIGSNY